jgi:uncharacterized protein (DUF1697 family)
MAGYRPAKKDGGLSACRGMGASTPDPDFTGRKEGRKWYEKNAGSHSLSTGRKQMPQFVVLLRGVNVGRGNRVPMAEFRRLLEGLGYAEVRTLLNSGNAVFSGKGRSAAGHSKAIADALVQQAGIAVPVIVIAATDFQAAVAGNPAVPAEAQHSSFLVAFGQSAEALQGLKTLAPLVGAAEHFSIGPHAAYLRCSPGILESAAAAALLGKMGRGVTTRNWATVLKLQKLLDA